MAVSKVNYGSDTLMDLTEDTVTPTNLMSGVTAHNSAGESITGILEATEITTTLSEDSTNEQVPSSKCVYDCLQEKQTKNIYVNVTADSDGNVMADKTYAEIAAAIDSGTEVTVIHDSIRLSLHGKVQSGVIFVSNVYGTSYMILILLNTNEWAKFNKDISSSGVTIDKSISASSTDSNVPSSKTVYDAIEAAKSAIPAVPSWALQETKPTYTADEVGADGAGKAVSEVAAHNTNTEAHNDMRLLIQDLTSRLNALADSDDTTLDQMSEIVTYIKNNKSLIDNITTTKVNVADIINNLTTNVSNKPLSAAQGVALKALIDAITVPTALSQLSDDSSHRLVTDSEKAAWNSKLDLTATNNAIKTFFDGKTVVFSNTAPTVDDQNVITFVKRSG